MDQVFGEHFDLVRQLAARLVRGNATIATAESCTGGMLAMLLTHAAGSSAYFQGGIVAYGNQVKIKQLGVQYSTLEQFGAVSEQTALEMARGVSERLGTQCAISITGIAGPDGGTPAKPVGTIWCGFVLPNRVYAKCFKLGIDRTQNRIQICLIALRELMLGMDADRNDEYEG